MDDKTKEVISQAAALVAIIQFIISFIAGALARLKFSTPISVLVGIVVFVVLIGACFIFKKQRKRISIVLLEWYRYIRAPKREKTIKNKVIEYTYKDLETMSLKVTYLVKFNNGSHNSIEEKMNWTAGPVNDISASVSSQAIRLIPADEKNDIQTFLGYQYFEIKFSKTYTSEDRYIPTGFIMNELKDRDHRAKSCLISGVYDKTDGLLFRLRFASNLSVSNIRKLKYIDYLDEEPYENVAGELLVDPNDRDYNIVEFKIPHPIFGGKYAIDWDFAE